MSTTPTNTRRAGPVTQLGRVVYLLGIWLFAAAIALQVFFAGLGALVNPGYWGLHMAWGNSIAFAPLVLLVIGLIGRLPWPVLALNALMLVLFIMQFVFLWVLPEAAGLPPLRALHAVNALALFWITVYLGQRAWRLIRESLRVEHPGALQDTGALVGDRHYGDA